MHNRFLTKALRATLYPGFRNRLFRRILARSPQALVRAFPYRALLEYGAVDRPHYGYCMYLAAQLATQLDHKAISVIEFGVAGGNGLLATERHAREISRELGIQFQIYGFDSGEGLPAPSDYRDLPCLWKPGFFAMDQDAIKRRLTQSRLVIGRVEQTCADFFSRYDPAPIGCIFWDLDFYSSTVDAFRILDGASRYFLPRVTMYFDDIIGEEHSDFTGERLAIAEFNTRSPRTKISPEYYIRYQPVHEVWKHQIYVYHNFDHPKYCEFVSPQPQQLPLG